MLQVKYWVDKVLHYGNTTTSRNESSHAAIKGYLRKSTGDHKHFFDVMCVFWEDQHRELKQRVSQAKVKPPVIVQIQLFQDVISFVHHFALLKILNERTKLPRKSTDPLPLPCVCSIQASQGLPCLHTIHSRIETSGVIALADIDAHWYYDRQQAGLPPPQVERRILLNPAVVKGKGRPKGATASIGAKMKVAGKNKGDGFSSTRRDYSLFEHEAFESTAPPPSTAPVGLGRGRPRKAPPPSITSSFTAPTVIDDDEAESPLRYSTALAVPRRVRSMWDAGTDEELRAISSTELALRRGAGGEEDLYDPGTLRERAYMRSLSIHALNGAAVDSLDNEVVNRDGFVDIDRLVSSGPKT